MYVHKESNHPKPIIENLPNMIQNRLSSISSDSNQFNKEVHLYNKALKDAGYENADLKFEEPRNRTRKRVRKIYYFNPPFSKNLQTNVTKTFNGILAKHFPKDHILHKVMNKNNNKISYSTTPNMGQIIAGHNKKLLREHYEQVEKDKNNDKPPPKTCNCNNPQSCPLDGKCLMKDIIYKAEVTADNTDLKNYIGLTATTFKVRHSNHKTSTNNPNSKQSITLSTYIWKLNARSEMMSKCRHQAKFTLERFPPK